MGGRIALVGVAAGQAQWVGRHMLGEIMAQAQRSEVEVTVVDSPDALRAAGDVLGPATRTVPADWAEGGGAAVARALSDAGMTVDALYTPRELALLPVAQAQALLGLAGNTPEAVAASQDKHTLRTLAMAVGLRQPASAPVDDPGRASQLARRFIADSPTGRIVVKPRNGTGSHGVTVCSEVSQLPAVARGWLIEEYVSGPEFSAEGFLDAGIAHVWGLTAKQTGGTSGVVEVGHAMPAVIAGHLRRQLAANLTLFFDAIGLRYGIFHAEFWIAGDEVIMGEVHGRPGGDWIHWMLSHILQPFPIFAPVFAQLLGGAVRMPEPPSGGAAVRFLTIPPGKLLGLSGWTAIDWSKNPGRGRVVFARRTVEAGETVPPVRDSGSRQGFALATGRSADDALGHADAWIAAGAAMTG